MILSLSDILYFSSYEASIICKGKKANGINQQAPQFILTHYRIGYGRNEQEAIANCIKNVFEFLMEDEANISLITQALKKGKYILSSVNDLLIVF